MSMISIIQTKQWNIGISAKVIYIQEMSNTLSQLVCNWPKWVHRYYQMNESLAAYSKCFPYSYKIWIFNHWNWFLVWNWFEAFPCMLNTNLESLSYALELSELIFEIQMESLVRSNVLAFQFIISTFWGNVVQNDCYEMVWAYQVSVQ